MRRYVKGTLETRFWAYVQKGDPELCWLWTGTRRPDGYGVLRVTGQLVRASRISYILNCGPLDADALVCHRCDNPPCVNPAHLFVGTDADNVADMHAKGRAKLPITRRGEQSHLAKLTSSDVRSIRFLHRESGLTHRQLAARFGISRGNVAFILAGKTWRTA